MKTETLDKLTRARIGLILDQPFFGSLALRLQLEEFPAIDTMCTNGNRIRYNPQFIDENKPEHIKTFFAHEVLHCALGHHARRDNRDPKQWNKACDYAINPILKEAGCFSLPSWMLYNPQFDNMSAEEIYSIIKNDSPGKGQGQGDGSGEGEQTPDPGKMGAVEDPEGKDSKNPSESELNQSEQDWKVAAKQAATQAKAQGKLPGSLSRFVDEILRPKVDWRLLLQQFVQPTAKSDYCMSPPNRRYIHLGLYMPSLKSNEMPPIVIGIDTSGSISNEQLNSFQAEIQAIMDSCPTTIDCFYCDHRIQGHDVFTRDNTVRFENCKGGGGTSFEPVFEEVERLGLRPECLIYLTDLEGSFPDHAPEYPVLWINTYNHEIAPFGTTVFMED
jgi:predicted metal-dependent peptidase